MDTKKLRQKILDLAIRGKLVPQDPNDEPASVLLDRIRAEKERLIAEGKIKRPKKSKASSADKSQYQNFEPPFEIPDSWEWVKIADISTSILYGVSESAKSCGNFRLLRITDIQGNSVDWSSVPFTDYDDSKANQYLLADGDILFARTGATVGKSYLVRSAPSNCIYASYLIRIQTSFEVLPEYLKLFFESGYYWQQITDGAVGVGQPNVNGTTLSQLVLPMPPKNEQIKIIRFVNSLLGFIDKIESSNNSLLDAITAIKSKILDLAMQGKLVPQDPSDEPATKMLHRVNPMAKIITDNPHYPQLPDNWVLTNLESINTYKSSSINPSLMPNEEFDLYSVPIFSENHPEVLTGAEIGSSKQKVAMGDVLLCKINPHLNRVWEIAELSKKSQIASSEWIVIRSEVTTPSYLRLFLSAPSFREMLCSQVSGVGGSLTRAQPAVVKKYPITIPPIEEQQRIVNKINILLSTLDEIEKSLTD